MLTNGALMSSFVPTCGVGAWPMLQIWKVRFVFPLVVIQVDGSPFSRVRMASEMLIIGALAVASKLLSCELAKSSKCTLNFRWVWSGMISETLM